MAEDALGKPITLDIPEHTRLEDALIEWGTKAGMGVSINSPTVEHQTTHGVRGTLRAGTALSMLLRDSGLSYTAEDGRIRVVPATILTRSAQRDEQPQSASSPSSSSETRPSPSGANDAQKKVEASAASTQKSVNTKELEEIVVTAQKREERLIDVPQSVSVLSGDALAKLGAVQFTDFANTVPGLSFTTAGAGATQITLRGVTTGFDIGSTVGIYVDDVPFGTSGAFAQGAQNALDVGLFDIDRIEVLRGPQGTLYGASAVGGVIKYVSKEPDMTNFGGDARAGVSGTEHGTANYNVAVAVNAPITGKVAVRASGFESHDGGYIDNVALGQHNVNRSDIYGGRIDMLIAPTDKLTIRIDAFLQDISRSGDGTVDYTFAGAEPYGSLGQHRLLPEPYDQRFRLISGTITYDMGPASLISISSYQTIRTHYVQDISPIYLPLFALPAYGSLSLGAIGYPVSLGTNKFTQEIRLASERSHSLEWLVGGFYTHESTTNEESFQPYNLALQPAQINLFTYSKPSTYQEYSAFGDLTWHLTSKFDVTGGVRYAHNSQETAQFGSGLLGASKPTSSSGARVFTYLADARYHFSDHGMGYVRYATGYRPGGPNFTVRNPITGLQNGPPTFGADELKNYEAGFKAETADRRFGVDVAGYYIDWSNIQVSVFRGGFGGIANAPGGAGIRGAELTLTARPFDALTLTGAFAYQDAYMKQANADLGAAKGERLPNVPRFTAALSADYQLPVGGMQPTLGATLRHVGDRFDSFDNSTGFPQYHLPKYTTVDTRLSFVLNPSNVDPINLQLYVHNLFDTRGQLGILLPQFGGRVAILQPRTIGIILTTHL